MMKKETSFRFFWGENADLIVLFDPGNEIIDAGADRDNGCTLKDYSTQSQMYLKCLPFLNCARQFQID